MSSLTASLTVQLVTYNSAATIEACIFALLKQNYPISLMVIDNASTDETVTILQRLCVPVIVNPSNIGYGAAHNQALKLQKSDYVLTLNPDVILQPAYIEQLIAYLEANPEIGSAMGCLLRIESIPSPDATTVTALTATMNATPPVIDSAGLFIRRNRRQGLYYEGQPIQACPTQVIEIFGPDGAAAMYRRKMLDTIAVHGEYFDEDFFLQKEDIDLCWRAQAQGWKAVCVPNALAHHIRTFRPGQRQRVNDALRRYGVRNRYLLLIKHETWLSLLRDLWVILPYDLGILGYILLFERSSLTAYSEVIHLAPRIWRKRRQLPHQHTVQLAAFAQYPFEKQSKRWHIIG